MKNKRIYIIWAVLLGLLFITACGGKPRLSSLLSKYMTVSMLGPKLSLSETTHNFAGVVLNNNADNEFTITNTGLQGGLEVSGISLDAATGPFSITGENCTSQSLAQNASCTFIVRFSPTAQGTFEGNISVDSNNPPIRTVTLKGDGYGLNVWINQADFSDCSDVKVDVTVTDPDGPVYLNTGDLTLWQNDTEQVITSVSLLENPDPVSVVIALDLSASLTVALPSIRTHAKYFVEQLGNSDEAAICKFREDIIFYPSPLFVTTDAAGKSVLYSYIDTGDPVNAGTSLYDATYASISRAATGANNKKAVIVLSDGNDESSSGSTLDQVINYAIANNVAIFSIFYVDPSYQYLVKRAIMQQMAEETGGQFYSADTSTMESIFDQIRNVLGSKYTIHYVSPNCSGSIPLRVRVDHDGLFGIDSRIIIH